MATIYSARSSKPLGAGRHAFGGAGLNLGVDALSGEGDIITTVEDFNGQLTDGGITGNRPGGAWTSLAIGVGATASVNDLALGNPYESSARLNCGGAVDAGGNAQQNVDSPAPRIWLPDTSVAPTTLDHTVVTLACRVGIISDAPTFDGKFFIGFAQDGDQDVMVVTSGAIAVASTGALVGLHINADIAVIPNISLIAKRAPAAAMAQDVNFTNLISGVDSFETGLTAGVPRWFDLAFRMSITNMSDVNSNGGVRAYFRRVPEAGGAFETPNREAPGLRETQASDSGAVKVEEWREHNVVLENQSPNDATALVPTIEFLNGPTNESDFLVDWLVMGISRFSRRGA